MGEPGPCSFVYFLQEIHKKIRAWPCPSAQSGAECREPTICHSERSEGTYRRAVGNGPYKAETHVSPRRGGNLPPAVWTITDPAAAEICPGTLHSNATTRPQYFVLRGVRDPML